MFESVSKELGRVKVGTSRKIIFDYSDIKVLSVTASCGCTSVQDEPNVSKITAIYTANPVPKHLELVGQTEYKSNKKIIVTYQILNDATEEVRSIELTFTAIVYK